MKTDTYHFTSNKFKGIVVLQYNEAGWMVSIDLTGAELEQQMINWFNNSRVHHFLAQFKDALKDAKNIKLVKIGLENVTFEMFWNRYGEKTRSSKKKALNCWNRLSQTDRDRAYHHIAIYERNIPAGVSKKYAETYLNAELWNN